MATWNEQASPNIKFETSPAESLLSTPGEMYPSLFSATATPPNTIDPMEAMTPSSFSESKQDVVPSTPAGEATAEAGSAASISTPAEITPGSAPSTEKKPAKKRKSWGQVLPEPKTNLPPRKRAKTEDEKEQRRVERVLRNRRAAQSSRERKRQEVEALEVRNKDLEARIHDIEKTNLLLVEELNKYRRNAGVVTRSSSLLDSLPGAGVALSQELFSSQDGHQALMSRLDYSSPSGPTVNPSSLSPEPTEPVVTGQPTQPTETAATSPSTVSKAADLTQRPAAMLCDLQCQSASLPRSWTASQTSMVRSSNSGLPILLLISVLASACQRPLTQIAMSLKAGFSLPPAPSILKAIIWLVTRPRSSRRSRSTYPSSSTRTGAQSSPAHQRQTGTPSLRTPNSVSTLPTLRITSLRKILTCSPNLARPLQDATMEALRLVSEGCHDQAGNLRTSNSATRDHCPELSRWLDGYSCPSKEALMALAWALKVEGRKLTSTSTGSGSRSGNILPTDKSVAKLVPGEKRGGSVQFPGLSKNKRQRLG